MKYAKCVILVLLIIFLTLPISFSADIPNPFSKAKEIALQAPMDDSCLNILVMQINRNGDSLIYLLAYSQRAKMIGIGEKKGNILTVYEYWEQYDKFSKYTRTGIGQPKREEISRDQAITEGYKIFREMVFEKLI